jgi:hypothetical protein
VLLLPKQLFNPKSNDYIHGLGQEHNLELASTQEISKL